MKGRNGFQHTQGGTRSSGANCQGTYLYQRAATDFRTSFAGRYLVLIPFNDKVSVSQKIKSSEERARLKQLLMSIKPKNFGVIVRTVAEGKRVAELDGELKVLLKHWEDAITKVQKATKFPTLIYEETSRAVGLLRDLFNPPSKTST